MLSRRMRMPACAGALADPSHPPLGTLGIWQCDDYRPFEYTQLVLGIAATGLGGYLTYRLLRLLTSLDEEEAGIAVLPLVALYGGLGASLLAVGVGLTVTSIRCLRKSEGSASSSSMLPEPPRRQYASSPALTLTIHF